MRAQVPDVAGTADRVGRALRRIVFPFLGDHPETATLIALKGLMVFAVGAWSDQHPKGRRTMLIVANIVNAYAVARNEHEGVVISVGWSF